MKNSNLKITFDFDDVIADTSHAFLDILHRDYGYHEFTFNTWTNFKVVKCSEVPTQTVIDVFEHLFKDTSTIQPIQSSIDFLNTLDDCTIVTARKLKPPVEEWFDKHLTNKNINLQIITTGSHNKLEELKTLKTNIHIDDRFETYSDLVLNTNIIPIVFAKPWNELYAVKNRIHQLDEIENIISEKAKTKQL